MKIAKYVLTFIVGFFLYTFLVKAIDYSEFNLNTNGNDAANLSPVVVSGCPTGNFHCLLGNYNNSGVRFSLVYYDGNSYENFGHIDIWKKYIGILASSVNYIGSSKGTFVNDMKSGSYSYITSQYLGGYLFTDGSDGDGLFRANAPYYPYNVVSMMSSNDYNPDILVYGLIDLLSYVDNEYVLSTTENRVFKISSDEIKKAAMGESEYVHQSSLACQEHEGDESFKCTGFRIFVEPIFLTSNSGKFYVLTPTEMAFIAPTTGRNGVGVTSYYFSDMPKYLYTTRKDVGILSGTPYPAKTGYTTSGYLQYMRNQLKTNVGYALNIIDPVFKDASLSCEAAESQFSQNKNNKGISLKDLTDEEILNLSSKYLFDGQYIAKGEIKTATGLISGNWTPRDYIKNCRNSVSSTDPSEGEYNCTPAYGVGTCLSGENVFYKDELSDSNYWDNCVFSNNGKYDIETHKTSQSGDLSYKDDSLGSEYCPVYCVEELSTDFLSNNITVLAGRHFSWINHAVSGSRTCKTQSINWNKYESDSAVANNNIESTYINWQLELKLNDITWQKSSSKDCDYGCTGKHTCSCGGEEDSYNCCCSYGYRDYYYTPSTTSVEFWGKTATTSTTCGYQPTFNPNAKERLYNAAIARANGITKNMNNCSTWLDENVYNLNPLLNISYSDTNYSYLDKPLNATTVYNNKVDNDCTNITSLTYSGCNTDKCSTTGNVNKCTYNNIKRSGVSTFDFSEYGVFQYVLKSNNLSIHASELGTYESNIKGETVNYIDIGYSNFPVAYKTVDGIYGESGAGELSLSYSNLGHMKYNTTALDTILSSKDVNYNNNYGSWKCDFYVNSELIVDNKSDGDESSTGINLIYRPIDLTNPFPNIDAFNRSTGPNWCSSIDCSSNNELVYNIITNNRGVLTDEIYNIEPMYTFVLTPSIIKEIRNYNDYEGNDYAEYVGNSDSEFYDYKCNKSTGTNCISDYLTHLIDITNARNYPGVCVNNSSRVYSDPTSFNNCRY